MPQVIKEVHDKKDGGLGNALWTARRIPSDFVPRSPLSTTGRENDETAQDNVCQRKILGPVLLESAL